MAVKGFVYLEDVQGTTLLGSYSNATGATVDSKWADCEAGSFTDDDAVVHLTRSGLFWNDVFVDAAGNVHPFIKGTAPDDSFGSMEGFSSVIPTIASIADANKSVTVNDTATGYDLSTGSGGTVAVVNGGTGQTTYTNGQLLIGNTTGNTLTKATLTGTANQVVVTNGTGSITLSTPQSIATTSSPTFAALTLTAPLTVPNGGLGAATFTDAGVLIGNGAGIVQVTTAGTAGEVLTSNGAGVDPTFQAAGGGGIGALYAVTESAAENSTSEVDVLTCSIPANEWADGEQIYLSWIETAKNNSGGTADLGLFLYYGASTWALFDGPPVNTYSDSSSTRRTTVGMILTRVGTDLYVQINNGVYGPIPWAPGANLTQDDFTNGYGTIIAAPGFGTTKNLKIAAQWSVADATTYYRVTGARALKI